MAKSIGNHFKTVQVQTVATKVEMPILDLVQQHLITVEQWLILANENNFQFLHLQFRKVEPLQLNHLLTSVSIVQIQIHNQMNVQTWIIPEDS